MNNFSVKIVFADANMPATNEDAPSVELARSALGSLLRRYAGVRNGYEL